MSECKKALQIPSVPGEQVGEGKTLNQPLKIVNAFIQR